MRTLSAAVIAAIMMTGLVQGQGKTDPALNKLAADFAAAYNARDVSKVMLAYTEDAVLMPSGEPMIKGRSAIAARLKQEFQQGNVTMTLSPIESSATGDRAYEAGTAAFTLPDGQKLTQKYVVIFKRVGGEWKIAYEISNPDTPPPPQK